MSRTTVRYKSLVTDIEKRVASLNFRAHHEDDEEDDLIIWQFRQSLWYSVLLQEDRDAIEETEHILRMFPEQELSLTPSPYAFMALTDHSENCIKKAIEFYNSHAFADNSVRLMVSDQGDGIYNHESGSEIQNFYVRHHYDRRAGFDYYSLQSHWTFDSSYKPYINAFIRAYEDNVKDERAGNKSPLIFQYATMFDAAESESALNRPRVSKEYMFYQLVYTIESRKKILAIIQSLLKFILHTNHIKDTAIREKSRKGRPLLQLFSQTVGMNPRFAMVEVHLDDYTIESGDVGITFQDEPFQ